MLEWSPEDTMSRILGLLLAPIVGGKVILIEPGTSDDELLREARLHQVNRIVLKRGEVSEELRKLCLAQGRVLQLLSDWEGHEEALYQEGVYPCYLANERLSTWSMPHPDERNSQMAQFQPGHVRGSIGRLFLGVEIPSGWIVDEHHFLKKESGGLVC